MHAERFAYVWRYTVSPAKRQAFLVAYNADGDWAKLFRRDSSYLGTTLLVDVDDENRFVTVDYWTSRAARDAFRERYAGEFGELDGRCEAYTKSEEFLGDYLEVVGQPPTGTP